MAEEARRNGGRNEPLIVDVWRPRSAAGRKHFGLKITHTYAFGQPCEHTYRWTQWYETSKARDEARIALSKNSFSKVSFEDAER